jgi:hypothetical protein
METLSLRRTAARVVGLITLSAGPALATPAVYTTFDTTLGGCLDSPNGVDCNNYEDKSDVFISGGPASGGLTDGTWWFTVYDPSGTQVLSSDAQANRTFEVLDGDIQYTGTHVPGLNPQGRPIIGLMPYADTPNAGGTYKLDLCTQIVHHHPHGSDTIDISCKSDNFRISGQQCDTPMTITCLPESQQVECLGHCNTPAEVSASADGGCPPVEVTCSTGNGHYCLGSTDVLCTATDNDSHSVSCESVVNVVDTQPPTITCPPSQTVKTSELPGNVCQAQMPVNATATDVCEGDLEATCNPSELSLNGPGTNCSTCSASDSSNNSANCAACLTLIDDTAPVVSCTTSIAALWPPNHKFVDVGLKITATDNCDSTPAFEVAGVTSDEPTASIDGAGGDIHAPDAEVSGTTVKLRAERSGILDGRVYRIVVKATDMAGNVGFGSCAVRVDHSQGNDVGGLLQGGAIDSRPPEYDATQIN